jgi:hypothetical protein
LTPLLQVNLSCNFFKGSFDVPRYVGFVDEYWRFLQQLEAERGLRGYGDGDIARAGTGAAPSAAAAVAESKED